MVAAAGLRPWARRTPRQPMSWLVKKGNAELLALIYEFLAQERGNGELLALQNKWLGTEMRDMSTSFTAEY